MLTAFLVSTFQAYAKITDLTAEAHQILNSVISASNDLFMIKIEQLPKGPTRSITFKTLHDRYPEFDPLLSDVKQDELATKLETWRKSIVQALKFIEENTFDNKMLEEAKEAYRDVYLFFGTQVLTKYRDMIEKKIPLPAIIRVTQERIFGNAMEGEGKRMIHARQNLGKKFGRITFNREDKNSTRALLIHLINELSRNINIVKKRIFELERELKD